MSRVAQSLLGALLLVMAGAMALLAVTSKGVVVMTVPLAAVILVFAGIGGFFVSKSLMTDAIKTVAGAVRRARKSGATPP